MEYVNDPKLPEEKPQEKDRTSSIGADWKRVDKEPKRQTRVGRWISPKEQEASP